MPSSRGSSQPRDGTRVSCIAGVTVWATREGSLRVYGESNLDVTILHHFPTLLVCSRDGASLLFQLSMDGDFSSVQLLSCVWLFVTPWTAARQASRSINNSRSLLKLMSIESMMPSNHLILCYPLLLPPPTSGFFPMSQLFESGGQSIGALASASVLPMNIHDWFPLGWTGWISLQSKRLSQAFSNTTVQNFQFFGTQISLESNSHNHTWLLEKPQLWLGGPLLV